MQTAKVSKQYSDDIADSAEMMITFSAELVRDMESVSAVVEENTAVTEEMAAGSNEIIQAIENIASVSEENSAAVEEVSAGTEEMSAQVEEVTASAESLADMARVLQNIVTKFKVDQEMEPSNKPMDTHLPQVYLGKDRRTPTSALVQARGLLN